MTLDDLNARNTAINDPGLFLQRYQPPIIIDEIQYAPKLMQYINLYVDGYTHAQIKGDEYVNY